MFIMWLVCIIQSSALIAMTLTKVSSSHLAITSIILIDNGSLNSQTLKGI